MYLTTSTYTPCSLPFSSSSSSSTATTTTSTTTKNLTTSVRSRTNSFLLRRPLLLISTTAQIGNSFQRDLQQQQQQQQQHFNSSSERKSTSNMMQSYIYSREQQQQQQQQQRQQRQQPLKSTPIDQLPVDRFSDFAAQMACYLWFCDNTDPTPNTPGGNGQRRYTDFRPRDAFKKFCRDVVSATQVSHSVILLSLLYIYRMKTNNPAIQGHPGSEFRTFTVALMLANKFLDDNTYTNKTWSEVTNISVREINIMEIEFLGSLDFSLYVSEQQYFDWVRTINQLVANDHDDHHYRDPRAPADCSISLPQQSTTIPQESYNVPVPMDTTISPRSFKRSAEQAFVDTGMVTSPPKRTTLYPAYTQPQSTMPTQSRQQIPTFQNLASQSSSTTTTTNNSASTIAAAINSAPIFYQLSSSFPQPPTNYELSTTKFIIQNVQHQYVMEQMQLLYARRSNYLNSRSTPVGFHPMNNVAFQTTVV